MKLPGLICDLNQVDTNAADMVARANGTPIRLASKSIHIPELLRYVLDKPGFSGILAYSLAEAIDLVRDGISDDILVAYPSTDRAAFAALAADDTLRRAITIMIDSPDHLGFLPTKTTGSAPFRICIDVDASWKPLPGIHFGTRRSPIYRPRHAARVAKQVRARPDTKLVGIMMYEGHIAGVPDTSWAIRLMKRRARRALAGRRARVVQAVSAGGQLEFVNGGGTGSLESTCAEEVVTEAGAGSGIIMPALFDDYDCLRDSPAGPALWFELPVVRTSAKNIITVAGGGRIASGTAHPNRLPLPPDGLRYLCTEGAGEVQTLLKGTAAQDYQLGDAVRFRHAKAGEGAEHANQVTVVRGGTVVDRWPTYRGLGRCYL